MKKLAEAIVDVLVYEYDQEEFLKRISDPYWFQGFACVLGYDWNSSGVTTVTSGVLKEALDPEEFGIAVCGGKGKTSRKTPEEIEKNADLFSLSTTKTNQLIYASKMSAKVDNSCLQDGFNLYHHSLIFTEKGKWAVVQQGMNPLSKYARRYHWLSEEVNSFVNEPHHAICSDVKGKVLNMVAKESKESRKACVDLTKENPRSILRGIKRLKKEPFQLTLHEYSSLPQLKFPRREPIKVKEDLSERSLKFILTRTYETQVKSFEELIGIRGIGPKTIRALALTADLIYGETPSWRDPAKYSFSMGGKNGYPYMVRPHRMEKVTKILKESIEQAKLGKKDKLYAIKRLQRFIGE